MRHNARTTSRPPDRWHHRARRAGVTAAILAASVAPNALNPASASAGGGYPWDSAVDCSSQFGTYSWCMDEDGTGTGSFSEVEEYSRYDFAYRNCTDYVAWKINSLGISFNNTLGGRRFGNAGNWDDNARALGWTVSATPLPRSIAVSNSGTWGHVSFVESVNADGSVNVSEYNYGTNGGYGMRNAVRFDAYIYVPGLSTTTTTPSVNVARYANTIVKWDGNSTTSWYVSPDLKRMWIPDGGTYNELKARGVAGPYVLNSTVLNQLPDQTNQWVASGSWWTGNRALRRGMSVRSSDGRYRFTMQTDGNLVLYGPTGRAIWATSWKTGGWAAQEYVIFQSDGNLVTYGGGRPIWWTGTSGRGTGFAVQSDGNLAVYGASGAVWASNTSGRT